jgi:hypothetical protein
VREDFPIPDMDAMFRSMEKLTRPPRTLRDRLLDYQTDAELERKCHKAWSRSVETQEQADLKRRRSMRKRGAIHWSRSRPVCLPSGAGLG